jgi:hypothetical protein
MSVLSYLEPIMGELNYWKDLMTRWRVGWNAGSELKAHVKMASLFAGPYITPPDYGTVEFPPRKEILLAQTSAVKEIERNQHGKATSRRQESPQCFDAGGMRMMNNAPWIPERAVDMQLRWCMEAQCHPAVHRAH